MTATTSARNTPSKQFGIHEYDVYQSTSIPVGVMVGISTSHGYALNGATSTAMVIVGCADKAADNSSGSSGDIKVKVKEGIFKFGNSSSSDEITAANIGSYCYCVDNQTVAKTDGSGTRIRAGKIEAVDSDGGVWVAMGSFMLANDAATLTGAESLTNKQITLPSENAPAFAAGDCAITPEPGKAYIIQATATNSTVSVTTTNLSAGDFVIFTADGTNNGHTVTYRDGSTAISSAKTALKRHSVMLVFDGTKLCVVGEVSP